MLLASGRFAPSVNRNDWTSLLNDEALVAEIKLVNTAEDAVDDEDLRRMVLPVIRADYRAIETYSCPPDVQVDCRITAFVGDRDPRVSVAEAGTWQRHTAKRFDLQVSPAGTFT